MPLFNLKKQLNHSYGARPQRYYFDGDMNGIRTYFDYRRDAGLDEFLIDDITWHDLSGDELFKRINAGLSTAGEQYLYYLLRSPAIEQAEYDKRARLIELMESDPDLRLKLQVILKRLGRSRAANTCEVFMPSSHSSAKLLFYILLVLALIGSAVSLAFTLDFLFLFIGLLFFLPIYHMAVESKINCDLETVNYSVSMVYSAKKIMNLPSPELKAYLSPFSRAAGRLKAISRVGYVMKGSAAGDIISLFNGFLLLDLIIYELLKTRLSKRHEHIFLVYEYLGRLDSAIAVASYRKSLPVYSIPQVDFDSSAVCFEGIGLTHPLVENAIPNDLDTAESALLTGSNASGKSTFLKTVALNAILAQGICTALGNRYAAPAFRIYSSMAMADDLLAGESYYIAEIKSLKRITEADTSKQPLLCVIDEVLRGTNTVERIAASSELLNYLTDGKTLCLAATHDIELCTLLSGSYRMLHFEEMVTDDGKILFDYRLKDGPAATRNALKLLNSIGFDRDMVDRANEKANRYTVDGKWV